MANTRTFWNHNLVISVHIKNKTIEEIVKVAREADVAYLEVVAERFWNLPDGGGRKAWDEIRDLLTKHSLRPIVHSTYILMGFCG